MCFEVPFPPISRFVTRAAKGHFSRSATMATTSLQLTCVSCFKPEPSYRCPKCLVKYCSVACFAAHKARTSCTGMKAIDDVVLQYIPRAELMGKNGYKTQPEITENAGISPQLREQAEEEMAKRQKLSDRDYNFLSLLERRVNVQRNQAQDILKRGQKRIARKHSGRGRNRNGRGALANQMQGHFERENASVPSEPPPPFMESTDEAPLVAGFSVIDPSDDADNDEIHNTGLDDNGPVEIGIDELTKSIR
ncbi:uncharacterized protein V1518DRAFT_411267 [Limtongia smithiae]|uniref:uncharacterized protein n=1 Tax=Limtongia smithiae TaxID=1125753 RepID=UPI0034CE1DA7